RADLAISSDTRSVLRRPRALAEPVPLTRVSVHAPHARGPRPHRRFQSIALALALVAWGCAALKPTAEQEWVTVRFDDCKTRTNAVSVVLDRVSPDGTWHATVAQTPTEYNRVVECMNSDDGSGPVYRRLAEGGNARAMTSLARMYERGGGGLS